MRISIPLTPWNSPNIHRNWKGMSQKTGLRSEMLSGIAEIGGYPTAIAIGDVGFIGGTCGSVIGEKVTRCIERSLEKQVAVSHCFREWWYADAGRHARLDADGKNRRRLCGIRESRGFFISLLLPIQLLAVRLRVIHRLEM